MTPPVLLEHGNNTNVGADWKLATRLLLLPAEYDSHAVPLFVCVKRQRVNVLSLDDETSKHSLSHHLEIWIPAMETYYAIQNKRHLISSEARYQIAFLVLKTANMQFALDVQESFRHESVTFLAKSAKMKKFRNTVSSNENEQTTEVYVMIVVLPIACQCIH